MGRMYRTCTGAEEYWQWNKVNVVGGLVDMFGVGTKDDLTLGNNLPRTGRQTRTLKMGVHKRRCRAIWNKLPEHKNW